MTNNITTQAHRRPGDADESGAWGKGLQKALTAFGAAILLDRRFLGVTKYMESKSKPILNQQNNQTAGDAEGDYPYWLLIPLFVAIWTAVFL